MRKDIEVPKAEKVYIVAVNEWDKEFTGQDWIVYLVNDREDEISLVLVMSRGSNEEKKTSTLRHSLGNVPPKSFVKVELIAPEVLGFTNEYLLTFFAENKLFERKFTFAPHSISDDNRIKVPVLECEGVLAE